MDYLNANSRIELKCLLKNLSKEELIDYILSQYDSKQVEDTMSGIDRNFQEDMIQDMDMGQDETIERLYY